MKQPRRLADAGADEFERGLLSASGADAPSDHAYHRTLASLGVGLLIPLSTAGAAHGAGVAAATSKLGATVVAKWLATGMALGAVTVSAVTVTGRVLTSTPSAVVSEQARTERPGPTTAAAHGAVAAALTPASAPTAAEPRPTPTPVPEAAAPKRRQEVPATVAESAPATTAGPSTGSFAAAPLVGSVPSIKRETELIGTAQRALQRGDGPSTLSALARYRSEFPHGALGPEARLLELSALLRTGQRDRARAAAAQIIAKDPTGQEADAARALLGKSHEP